MQKELTLRAGARHYSEFSTLAIINTPPNRPSHFASLCHSASKNDIHGRKILVTSAITAYSPTHVF